MSTSSRGATENSVEWRVASRSSSSPWTFCGSVIATRSVLPSNANGIAQTRSSTGSGIIFAASAFTPSTARSTRDMWYCSARLRATPSECAKPSSSRARENEPPCARTRTASSLSEVSPQADAATRTFQVKVGITDPPERMRLGSTVIGRIKLPAPPGVEVPESALTEADGHPAVWIVDPQSRTVSLRTVEIARYDQAAAVISKGLETGEFVVTAGVQALRPGQKVSILGAAS